jgi:hypothetical protein
MEESMNRKLKILLPVCVLLGLVMVPWGGAAGPEGQSGASNIGHLYLYQQDPDTGQIDGAWGKLKYNLTGPTFDFLFSAHELSPGTAYTLVYFKELIIKGSSGEDILAPVVICLGSAVADENGNVCIKDSVNCGSLPQFGDQNNNEPYRGAKIRLFLSNDVDCKTGSWNYEFDASNCLFGNKLITYTATP